MSVFVSFWLLLRSFLFFSEGDVEGALQFRFTMFRHVFLFHLFYFGNVLHASGFVFFIISRNSQPFLQILPVYHSLYIFFLRIQLVIFWTSSLYLSYLIISHWYYLSPCLTALHSEKFLQIYLPAYWFFSSVMFDLLFNLSTEFFISTIAFFYLYKFHIFHFLICLVIPNSLLLLAHLCVCIYYFLNFIYFFSTSNHCLHKYDIVNIVHI